MDMINLQRRAAWLLVLVWISVAACQAPPAQEPAVPGDGVVISGRLRTATGEVPSLAHAHVGPPSLLGLKSSETIAEVAADGSFELTVDGDGIQVLALALTALHHETATVPLVLGDDTDRVELGMTLQARPVTEEASVVRIEGDLNADMERRDDGTWAYTVEDPGERLSYRVRMGGVNVREIDGTQADRYEPKSYGYKAVIEAASGPVEIVFDPGQLPPRGGDDLPRLSTDHEPLARAFALKKAMDKAHNEAKKMRMAGEKPDYRGLYGAARGQIVEALASEDSAALRGYAAVQALSVRGDVTAEEEKQAFEQLPVDSPFWSLVGVQGLDSQQHGELLEGLRSHPDAGVSADALAALVKGAKRSGDTERWKELYAELEEVAEASPRLLMTLNPEPRIAVGKPIPDFDLALFESSFEGRDTVSKADLLGRVYLIDFWGTWCFPCLKEIPKIREVWEKYKERDFQVLSMAVENSPDVIRNFMNNQQSMPWLHHYVEGNFNSEILKTFEVTSYPRPILVDADGNILATDKLHGEDIMETVGKALGE
jgi:thiol-disulfide isomerase/thioredoxin